MFISTVAKMPSKTAKLTPMVRLGNRTIGVNLGVFRSLFEFAKGCVFSSAFLESASIFK